MLEVAKAEVGYQEKAGNYDLDSKNGNAGRNNYTKYWRDMYPAFQGEPWCDCFISWCGKQAGETDAVGVYYYCPAHVNFFKNLGQWKPAGTTPMAGWIIFFKDSDGDACHVGIVEYVSGGYVHTIEGNTSPASGVVANGGGVYRKSYSIYDSYILGYGCPAYTEKQVYEIGWRENAKGKWYVYDEDGNYYKNQWAWIGDTGYYFDSEGYMMKCKFQFYDGDLYYLGEDGKPVTSGTLKVGADGKVVPVVDTIAGTGDKPTDWAKEATAWAKEHGVFNGDGAGNYGWQMPITREQVAQVLYNLYGDK